VLNMTWPTYAIPNISKLMSLLSSSFVARQDASFAASHSSAVRGRVIVFYSASLPTTVCSNNVELAKLASSSGMH
jgi:hypothetical protein